MFNRRQRTTVHILRSCFILIQMQEKPETKINPLTDKITYDRFHVKKMNADSNCHFKYCVHPSGTVETQHFSGKPIFSGESEEPE